MCGLEAFLQVAEQMVEPPSPELARGLLEALITTLTKYIDTLGTKCADCRLGPYVVSARCEPPRKWVG